MRSQSLFISIFTLDVSRGNRLGRSTRDKRRKLPGHQERMLVVDYVLWGVLVVFRKAVTVDAEKGTQHASMEGEVDGGLIWAHRLGSRV